MGMSWGLDMIWLARVAELWAEDGVEEHVKKAVEEFTEKKYKGP